MTTRQIEAKAARAQVPYQLAKQIRELLDAARKAYGAEDWDVEELERKVVELATEEV